MSDAHRLTYLPVYMADFFGDDRVTLMDGPEKGAHLLLCLLSAQSGPIKDPRKALRALGFAPAVWNGVADAWLETEHGWIQSRVEAERAAASERIEKARKAGKMSAKQRHKDHARNRARSNSDRSQVTPRDELRSNSGGNSGGNSSPPQVGFRVRQEPNSTPTSQSQSQSNTAAAHQQQLSAREGEADPVRSQQQQHSWDLLRGEGGVA